MQNGELLYFSYHLRKTQETTELVYQKYYIRKTMLEDIPTQEKKVKFPVWNCIASDDRQPLVLKAGDVSFLNPIFLLKSVSLQYPVAEEFAKPTLLFRSDEDKRYLRRTLRYRVIFSFLLLPVLFLFPFFFNCQMIRKQNFIQISGE